MYVNHLRCIFLPHLGPLPALDPQISYEGMRVDYANDDALAEHLENSKSALFEYFHKNYLTDVVGSMVAVEHVFSGGQDTISLRRASLNANTICILMLAKIQAHLAHIRSK